MPKCLSINGSCLILIYCLFSFFNFHPLAVAGKAYLSLRDNFSVSFQPTILSPLLSMCSLQTSGSLVPKPYLVAEKVFDDLNMEGMRRASVADHINILKTQINCHRYSRLDVFKIIIASTCTVLSLNNYVIISFPCVLRRHFVIPNSITINLRLFLCYYYYLFFVCLFTVLCSTTRAHRLSVFHFLRNIWKCC